MHPHKKLKTNSKYIDRAQLRRQQEQNNEKQQWDGTSTQPLENNDNNKRLDFGVLDRHDSINDNHKDEQQLDDDEYDRLLEDALKNPQRPNPPSNLNKSRSEILSELKKSKNQSNNRKSKFRPINRPKSPSPQPPPPPQTQPPEPLQKVKYVMGSDGKMKRMIKRSKPKGTNPPPPPPPSNKQQNNMLGEKPLSSEQRPPPSSNLTPPEIKQDSTKSQEKQQPVDREPSEPAKQLTPIPSTSPQPAPDSGSDIFSDAASDYDPFASDREDENEKIPTINKSQSPARDYFSTGQQQQSAPSPPENKKLATARIVAQAIQGSLKRGKDEEIEEEDEQQDMALNEKLVPLQTTDDYGDIDIDLGGEGRWIDDEAEVDGGGDRRKSNKPRRRGLGMPKNG